MKNLINVFAQTLLLCLVMACSHGMAQNSFKIKLVKRAKVNKNVYRQLSNSVHGQGLQMLGNLTIGPKKGFLLFQVDEGTTYFNVATDDAPSEWAGVKEVEVDDGTFRLPFSDGGYLWSKCICPNVNDGCSLTADPDSGGGLSFKCTGLECCTQKWGYIDPDGKGTVFE